MYIYIYIYIYIFNIYIYIIYIYIYIYTHTRSTITVQDPYFSFTGLRYLGLVFVFYLIIYLKALLQCCYFIKVLLMTIEN